MRTGSRSPIRASGDRGFPFRRGASVCALLRHGGADPGVYPDLAVTVQPHLEPERGVRATTLQWPGRVRRVAVLGGIGVAEGGQLLKALATDAQDRNLPLHFAIAGLSDPTLTHGLKRAEIIERGRYSNSNDDPNLDRPARAALQIAETDRHWEDDKILDLAGRISANLVLLPAI